MPKEANVWASPFRFYSMRGFIIAWIEKTYESSNKPWGSRQLAAWSLGDECLGGYCAGIAAWVAKTCPGVASPRSPCSFPSVSRWSASSFCFSTRVQWYQRYCSRSIQRTVPYLTVRYVALIKNHVRAISVYVAGGRCGGRGGDRWVCGEWKMYNLTWIFTASVQHITCDTNMINNLSLF